MNNLVIVESPAKAKTIEGFLGSDFVVKSCYGHIRELPRKGDPIDIENKKNDLTTGKLVEFNNLINNDKRIETVIFPVRDGLSLSRKI